MSTIEEMRSYMLNAGIYTKADIDKICDLEQQYRDECQDSVRLKVIQQTEATMNSVVQRFVNIMIMNFS